jgi:hypothetical protein
VAALTQIETGQGWAEAREALTGLSIDNLRKMLATEISVTAQHIAKMAMVWAELERRGEDMSALRSGIARYLPAVAARRLLPEAVVRLAGNTVALRAIASLVPDEQRRVLDLGTINVVCEDGGAVQAIPITELSQSDARRAIDVTTGCLIAPGDQRHPMRRVSAQKYTARIVLPLTREEHRKLQDAASRTKRSASELIRQLLKNDGSI